MTGCLPHDNDLCQSGAPGGRSLWCGGMPLPEPAAGLTSRWLFPSLELFDRTKSCGVLESRTASEMTDLRVPRLGRRVSPPVTTETPIEGVRTPWDLYCGIDWATDHHDVAVVDDNGRVVARGRVGNDAAGFAQLLTLLAAAGDTAEVSDPGGDRNRPRTVGGRAARHRSGDLPDQPAGGLAVSGTLCGVGSQIRCHRRGAVGQHRAHRPGRAPAAARRHRAGPGRSGCWLAPSKTRCGRASRSATRSATCSKTSTRPRSRRSPTSDGGLARPDARTILAAAPTPAQAAKLTPARLRRLLVTAGRQRYLDRDVDRLREVFTDSYLHQPPVVENAMGIQLTALLRQF